MNLILKVEIVLKVKLFTLKNGLLNAFNGSYLNAQNSLQGQVEVDGQVYTFDMDLNPDFDQVAFDAAYVCE